MNQVAIKQCVDALLKNHHIIYTQGEFRIYKNGIYKILHQAELYSLIQKSLKSDFSIGLRNECVASLGARAYLSPDSLNQPRHLINLSNGLLSLDTFGLSAHSAVYHFQSQVSAAFDTAGECPKWSKFLDETFFDDKSKIDVLQEFFGYCLTPSTRMEKSLILIGEGANGKSVILEVLRGIIGEDNSSSISLDQIGNSHYLAELHGKMVNISTETSIRSRSYEALFKQLVTGEMVIADRKYSHPLQFKNTCKLVFAMNEMPRIDDKSDAFYRRMMVIPCNNCVPESLQNRNLPAELLAESAGILKWSIEGLNRLRKQAEFSKCSSIAAAIQEYRHENNNVLVYVEDNCLFEPRLAVPKSELYQDYNKCCLNNGCHPLSKINFGRQLKIKYPNISETRTETAHYWTGISIKSASNTFSAIELSDDDMTNLTIV